MWGLYKEGCTLQVHQPQRYFGDLAGLCWGLEQRLGCLVGINAYLTPPATQVKVFSLQNSNNNPIAFPLRSPCSIPLSCSFVACPAALLPPLYRCLQMLYRQASKQSQRHVIVILPSRPQLISSCFFLEMTSTLCVTWTTPLPLAIHCPLLPPVILTLRLHPFDPCHAYHDHDILLT